MSSSRPYTMTDEEEALGVPMQDMIGRKYWESDDFLEWYAPRIYEIGKNKAEEETLKEAFNLYACGRMPIINLPRVRHDSKKAEPYIKALDKIKELFTDDDDEYADEILEYIEGRIGALSSSQVTWQKLYKSQAQRYLSNNDIKEYRHKKIFTTFNKILDSQE